MFRPQFLPLCGAAATPQPRPHILFYLPDNWGWTDSPVYGSRHYDTPHKERLAQRGTVSTDVSSASPLCSLTRAGILTGKHVPAFPPRYYETGPQHPREFKLYNLREELSERTNLAEKMPAAVREWNGLIDGCLRHAGAVVPKPDPAWRKP